MSSVFNVQMGPQVPINVFMGAQQGLAGAGTSMNAQSMTATAGQTLFTGLNTYVPGVNLLAVYQNGAKLIVGLDYTETSGTSITLTSGASAGDNFQFMVLTPVAAGVTDSSSVTYLPSGSGAVQTSVQAKLRQTVSVLDFGADPTGVVDSTAAIQAALYNVGAHTAGTLPTIIFGGQLCNARQGTLTLGQNGTYKISSALVVPPGVTLDLNGSTIYQSNGAVDALFCPQVSGGPYSNFFTNIKNGILSGVGTPLAIMLGTISGNTLTVNTGTVQGTIAIGQALQGWGGVKNCTITAGSGSSWTISGSAQYTPGYVLMLTCAAIPTGGAGINTQLSGFGSIRDVEIQGFMFGYLGQEAQYTEHSNLACCFNQIGVYLTDWMVNTPGSAPTLTSLDNHFDSCLFSNNLIYGLWEQANGFTTYDKLDCSRNGVADVVQGPACSGYVSSYMPVTSGGSGVGCFGASATFTPTTMTLTVAPTSGVFTPGQMLVASGITTGTICGVYWYGGSGPNTVGAIYWVYNNTATVGAGVAVTTPSVGGVVADCVFQGSVTGSVLTCATLISGTMALGQMIHYTVSNTLYQATLASVASGSLNTNGAKYNLSSAATYASVTAGGYSPGNTGGTINMYSVGASIGQLGASITATISGTTLTVSAVGFALAGSILLGAKFVGIGLTPFYIVGFGTGTGTTGTYTISNSQTVSTPTLMYSPTGMFGEVVVSVNASGVVTGVQGVADAGNGYTTPVVYVQATGTPPVIPCSLLDDTQFGLWPGESGIIHGRCYYNNLKIEHSQGDRPLSGYSLSFNGYQFSGNVIVGLDVAANQVTAGSTQPMFQRWGRISSRGTRITDPEECEGWSYWTANRNPGTGDWVLFKTINYTALTINWGPIDSAAGSMIQAVVFGVPQPLYGILNYAAGVGQCNHNGFDSNGYVKSFGFNAESSWSGDSAWLSRASGDYYYRHQVNIDGTHLWGTGYGATDTTLTRVSAGLLGVTVGSFSVQTAGQGLRVKEGSNAKQGVAILAAGSVVVANTSVTATSRILLTSNADGGTPGWLRVSARAAGTSFTITSSSGTDTSTVAYQIFEPA